MEFRVPPLGEGIDSATVVRVLVAEGAAVNQGQEIVEVETEKSTFPIPAPAAGTVEKIRVQPADKITADTVLMTTTDGAQKSNGQPKPAAAPAKPAEAPPTPPKAAATPKAAAGATQRLEVR